MQAIIQQLWVVFFYLGAKADENGVWTWTDGTPFNFRNGMDLESGVKEIYLAMNQDGNWHDLMWTHTTSVACATSGTLWNSFYILNVMYTSDL